MTQEFKKVPYFFIKLDANNSEIIPKPPIFSKNIALKRQITDNKQIIVTFAKN